jgi:WhiB family redox-sensing transcriptional regulator
MHDLALTAKVALGSSPWTERAACRDAPGGDFFVDMYPSRRGAEIATAKAICATCPVNKQCLSAGRNEEFGIWGGFTAEERRRLPSPRRQRVG